MPVDQTVNTVQVVPRTITQIVTIQIPDGTVLRGAGSDAATGTTIVSTKGGPVLAIGTEQDQACYDSNFDGAAKPLLTADAKKETGTLAVTSARSFSARLL